MTKARLLKHDFPVHGFMLCKQEDRAELKGTNYVIQTGFCENLRFAAGFCENLRLPTVFCEDLRLWNASIPRKSENQQKSAESSERLRIWLRLSLLVCPFYFPLRSAAAYVLR